MKDIHSEEHGICMNRCRGEKYSIMHLSSAYINTIHTDCKVHIYNLYYAVGDF